MARLLELTGPIQEREMASLESELCNLQGNILRGHGRDRSLHVTLRGGEYFFAPSIQVLQQLD